MTPTAQTPDEMETQDLYQRGLEALARELGPVGMARFLQMFEKGHGDYTAERHQWLPQGTVEEIAESINRRRNQK